MKVNTNIKMEPFVAVSTTTTTFSCRYCGGSHKGKSGMEIHLKTHKHKNAVQKHNKEEQKKESIRRFKRDLETYTRLVKECMEEREKIEKKILELALEE